MGSFQWEISGCYYVNIDCDRTEITYLYQPCNNHRYRYTIAETSDPFLQYTGMIYKVHHAKEFSPDEILQKAITCEIKYDFKASSIYTDFATYCKTGQETGTMCPLCSQNEKNRFPDYEQHQVRSVQEIQGADFIIIKSNCHHQHAIVVNVDKEKELITVVSCSRSGEKKSIHKTVKSHIKVYRLYNEFNSTQVLPYHRLFRNFIYNYHIRCIAGESVHINGLTYTHKQAIRLAAWHRYTTFLLFLEWNIALFTQDGTLHQYSTFHMHDLTF